MRKKTLLYKRRGSLKKEKEKNLFDSPKINKFSVVYLFHQK
jgi:hypothetical protein